MSFRRLLPKTWDELYACCIVGGGILGANAGAYTAVRDGNSIVPSTIFGGVIGFTGGALVPFAAPMIVLSAPGYAYGKLSDRWQKEHKTLR